MSRSDTGHDNGISQITDPTSAGDQEHENQAGDSDDEFEAELLEATLDAGSHSFSVGNWQEATLILQDALKLLRKMPINRRPRSHDLLDIQYKLAMCAFHTSGRSSAEAAFLSIVEHDTESARQQILMCDAGHHLALIYIGDGRLEPARISCESVIRSSKRLGQTGRYYGSLALMAWIQEGPGRPWKHVTVQGVLIHDTSGTKIGFQWASKGETTGRDANRRPISAEGAKPSSVPKP